MKSTSRPSSRRAFIKTSALGLGALGAGASALASATAKVLDPVSASVKADAKQPTSDISVWSTSGKQRFAAGQPISWRIASSPPAADSIQLVVLGHQPSAELAEFAGSASRAVSHGIDCSVLISERHGAL